MSTIAAPASTAEAVDMYLTSLRYLAATDPTTLAAAAQAECLQALEQGDAMSTAARAICGWTDKLPASCWDAADEILIGVARAGASQGDLAGLAARSRPVPA